jgi:endonuclease/exonuclease/phosphatase family metal-dependent hydrolase
MMERNKLLSLATWNIGGGILGESHQRDGRPILDYHTSLIKETNPDVICLQEAHDYGGAHIDQARHIGERAGYPFADIFPYSPSHLQKGASLSLGIISRFPLTSSCYKQFPNPGLRGSGPNGEEWSLFDKGYVELTLDIDGRTITLANAHCFPLHHFHARPTEGRFANIWNQLIDDLLAIRRTAPALVAIDLNHQPIEELLGPVLRPDKYYNAFNETPTTPKGTQQDYILYDNRVRLVTTVVKPTEADHSYCQATLEV